ncbi:taste receptor type 2 member 16 [Pteronotus mesoamericanus]|uniref:taste receptor type 2 member 16 n=1 Tax=Pteronotus mesoamericanus TaxID=1884717 RepID=UPI0023EC48F5|nr:taste receptor type 2 member 16 [Pteronotus parnellii mesoamericanus]
MIPNQLSVFFMVIYFLESLTIILQSSLIVAVLSREWVQVKRLSPVDMIFISLGVCRFCLQWSSVLYNFCSYFSPNFVLRYVSIFWEYTNTLTFWLTSLLAFVYCVKISSFTHPIFLWLRWRILRLIPWMLLGSLLISCVTIIFSAFRYHSEIQLFFMMQFPGNNTVTERLKTFVENVQVSQQMVMLTIPFLLFLASTILLIVSLSQHSGQMQHHNTGHSNSSMKALSTALRFLAFVAILFTSYFLSIIFSTLHILWDTTSWFWAGEAVIYAIVSIHSTSLMLSNPKFKKVLKVRVRERFWGPRSSGGWWEPISHPSGILREKKEDRGWVITAVQAPLDGRLQSQRVQLLPALANCTLRHPCNRSRGAAARARALRAPRPLLKIPFHVLLVVGATGSPPAFGRSPPGGPACWTAGWAGPGLA